MKRKSCVLFLSAAMALSLMACGGGSQNESNSETEVTSSEKEYISESEIPNIFTNPGDYEGKYVKLTGRIFTAPEQDEEGIALQAFHDIQNYDLNFIVYVDGTDHTFDVDDYISVDGMILGEFEGENAFGGTVTAPMIDADSIEVLSYMDAVAPTVTEITPDGASSEQYGITLTVDKIEFAENETRVYMTESNASEDTFNLYTYMISIVQNGQQIEQDMTSSSIYEGGYEELSDNLLPGASSSGVLVFPAMDSSAGFQIHAEGMSSNYEQQFEPFVIEVSAQ